jgi:hypothetical protein
VLLAGTTSWPAALILAPVRPPLAVMVGKMILGVPLKVAAAALTVSLPSKLMVPPATEPTEPESLTASISTMVAEVLLLVARLSLAAPVAPFAPTVV